MMDTEAELEEVLDLLICRCGHFFLEFPSVFTIIEMSIFLLFLDHFNQVKSCCISLSSFVCEYDDLFSHCKHPLEVVIDDVIHDVVGSFRV